MKVKCLNPLHTDDTPSMEVYPEGTAYCFSCGYYLADHDLPSVPTKPKADIHKEMEHISGLTLRQIRGLYLPADEQGYYIVWPDRGYYKKRLLDGKTRYIGPAGHRAPLFVIPGKSKETLVVIEGEINALSMSYAIGDIYTIVSPGSCNEMTKCITYCLDYSIVYVIVDKDVAGVINGLKLKDELISRKKRVQIIAKETDYNQTLQDKGSSGLKETVYRDLGLSRELPSEQGAL